MITPAFALTATERILPNLALDFTTASLDSRVTFTRSGNTATVINSSGTIVAINADLPRFDYNPSTLACNGLLLEEARTNLLLNSLLDGTSLSTQSVTVTAAAHTLSFYGTGSVVLSGTHSATVNGSGAYPTRTTLTFTPTAGTLTLTVTGTVQFANLELGSFATSFIPTDGTVKTRNADAASMTGTNFSSWYNASEGAIAVIAIAPNGQVSFGRLLEIDDTTNNNRIVLNRNNAATNFAMSTSSVSQASFSASGTWSNSTKGTVCFGYKKDNLAASLNGGALGTDLLATIPTVTQMLIGSGVGASMSNATISKIMYWPQRITDAEVRAFAK